MSKAVEDVYRSVERGPVALQRHEAAEILLVARWFELRPRELERTVTPQKWLEEGAIRPLRRGKRRAPA